MKLSVFRSRDTEEQVGVTGIARRERRSGGLARIGPGDIAVLNQTDMDRRTADALVSADVAGVVNAAKSISGRFPNLGPEVLLAAGIPLVDDIGIEALHRIPDGKMIRIDGGSVYVSEELVASGTEQTVDSVADQMIEAKAGMSAQLEAFSANTMEFLRSERLLVLDGVGVPDIGVSMANRHALVIAPGPEHAAELRRLRRYIREYRPVLLGVDEGADTLCAAGYTPDLVVGDPESMASQTLRCGAIVVLPAHGDGHAPGLERIQDLGIPSVAFSSTGNAEDLALLLADAHGAELVVTVGSHATLHEFLDRGRSGSIPSTFLTRLRLGGKLVDSNAVASLHRGRTSAGSVLLLIVSALLVLLVALFASGLVDTYLAHFADGFSTLVSKVKGLF